MAEQAGENNRIANAATHLGVLLRSRGDHKAATAQFERALGLYRAADDRPNIARTLNNLGSVAQATDRNDEAETLYRQAMAVGREGDNDAEAVVVAAVNLASLMSGRGEYSKALVVLKDAKARATDDPSRPRLAGVLGQMGVTYRRLGQFDEAEAALREAVALRRSTGATTEAEISLELNNLGDLLSARERFAESIPLLEEAASRCAKSDRGWRCASMVNNLGSAQQGLGHSADAEASFREAQRLVSTGGQDALPVQAAVSSNLGKLYAEQKKRTEARRAYDAAMRAWELSGKAAHPDYASTLTNIAVLEMGRGKFDEAETLMRRALTIDERFLGSGHMKVATDQGTLATILAKHKDYAGAERLMRESLRVREALAPRTASTSLAMISLGEALALQKKYAEAAEYFERALKVWDDVPGTAPANQLSLLMRYEQILRRMEEYGQAEMVAARAMRIRVKATIAQSAFK